MAKLRNELMRKAENREGGAKDLTLRSLKPPLMIELDPVMREVRNEQGRVYKMVSVLKCMATVAGVPAPITHTCEMEAGEQFGVFGEIEQCLAPALREFLDKIKAAVNQGFKEKAKPLDPTETKPLLSDPDRPKDLNRSERMKALNARRKAERDAAKAAQEEEAAGEAEGGES